MNCQGQSCDRDARHEVYWPGKEVKRVCQWCVEKLIFASETMNCSATTRQLELYVLRIIKDPHVAVVDPNEPPRYLSVFDADWNSGRGLVHHTKYKESAMTFESEAAAVALCQTVSTVKPLAEDGSPNRPLTRYTVVIEPYW